MPHADLSTADPARLDVTTEWRDKELIKQVPGCRWDSKRSLWTVPRSWAACLQLRSLFGQTLTLSEHLKAWAFHERERVAHSVALRDQLDGPPIPDATTGWEAFAHQRGDVAWALSTVSGGLLTNDMGLAKTGSVLSTFRRVTGSLPAIVICPNSTKGGWEKQAAAWWPEATVYTINPGAGRAKVLKVLADDPNALVIVNYETARTLSRLAPYGSVRLKRCVKCGGGDETVKETSCEAHSKVLNEVPFRTVIVDEAHRLKDPKAKQTRAVWAIGHGPSVWHRFALTGTPIANHIGDFWSIGHFLAPHEYPTRSAFLDRYALLSWNSWGGMDIVGIRPDTRDEFFAFTDARVRRVSKAQVDIGLPPKLRTVREVHLPPKARKAYTELEDDLVTKMPDGSVVFAPNSLTQSLRLLQLSSAFSELNDAGELRLVDKPASWKLDELEAVVAELGTRQFCVAAMSRQLIELAAERFDAAGIRYGKVVGGQKKSDRDWYLAEFEAGRLQAMLFTLQAGGTGVDGMQVADTLVFLQRDWSIINNKQAEDRVHRIGSDVHTSVNIIDIVTVDTVEVRQIERLHEKLTLLDEFNRDGNVFEPTTTEDDLRGLL